LIYSISDEKYLYIVKKMHVKTPKRQQKIVFSSVRK